MEKELKTLVVIPAYNEEKNLPSLLGQLQHYNWDVLVVNDCSHDSTREVLTHYNNIKKLNLPVNVGLAGVTQFGFRYASENNYNCAIVIDGDGQHPPKYIQNLVNEIYNGYDYVIGSRFVTDKKPFTIRMIGSNILSFLIKVKTGKTIHDPTSGMRALSSNLIKEFGDNMNFIAEPDAVTYILRNKYKVKEVQVNMEERKEGTSYFKNPFKSIAYMFQSIISILFLQ